VWTPLDYPGSTATEAHDIQGNNIVGAWDDSTCKGHGFLFNGSTWTSLNYPGAGNTWPNGIDGGNIVGQIFGGNLGAHGFKYNSGSWTLIDYPGAYKTHPQGIEGNNIVGSYIDTGGRYHGFLYNGSTWQTLDYPGDLETQLFKIKGGTIFGAYGSGALLGGIFQGVLYKNGIWTTFNIPGAPTTMLLGGDISSNLVGFYQDGTGYHGFLAAPIGLPGVTTNSATNVTGNSAALNGTVNPNGSATTYYFQWGMTTAYGNNTPSQSAGSGTGNVAVSANLTSLTPNTTYHNRLVGTNNTGTVYGSDMTFKTKTAAIPWLLLLLGE
jgi:hypothetical protein